MSLASRNRATKLSDIDRFRIQRRESLSPSYLENVYRRFLREGICRRSGEKDNELFDRKLKAFQAMILMEKKISRTQAKDEDLFVLMESFFRGKYFPETAG